MIPDSEQKREQRQRIVGSGELTGVLSSAGTDLAAILAQVGTPELFRRDTAVPLASVGSDPLVVVNGRLSFARILVNGPAVPIAELVPGDIFCPRALHPIILANSFLVAEEETMAYSIAPEHLAGVRASRPDLAAMLDRQINDLLRRLLDETETLLRSLSRPPE